MPKPNLSSTSTKSRNIRNIVVDSNKERKFIINRIYQSIYDDEKSKLNDLLTGSVGMTSIKEMVDTVIDCYEDQLIEDGAPEYDYDLIHQNTGIDVDDIIEIFDIQLEYHRTLGL